jgi:two-component system, LytTR family, response regulator
MQTLDVLIVDDEAHVRSVLARLLKDFFGDAVTVTGEAGGVNEAWNKINLLKPHLVLLDIEMHGEDGFQLLELFGKSIPFDVIFVTSYDQYAIRAIKHSALDYLLKPVMLDEFKAAINKAILRRKEQVNISAQVEVLQQNVKVKEEEQSIVLNHKTRIESVYCKDVVWLEGDINYTIVHLQNGKKHHVAKTLKEFEETLCGGSSRFLRIHKTSIINTEFVQKIMNGQTASLLLKTGQKLEVSRRKKTEVMQVLSLLGR